MSENMETLTSFAGPEPQALVQAPLRWVDRGWYLVLEFYQSSSRRFDQTVELARSLPNFQELTDEKSATIYRNIFFEQEFHRIRPLYECVQNWKQVRIFVNGDPITKTQFDYWYSCQQFYWQSKPVPENAVCGRGKAAVPDFLGCHNRNIFLKWRDPLMNSYHYSSRMWYAFGDLEEAGLEYVVNKPAMLAFLEKVNANYRTCPCYRRAWIQEHVDRLPDRIGLSGNGDGAWITKEDYVRLNRTRFYHPFIIGYSDIPEICPKSQNAYEKYMSRLFPVTNE